MTTPNIEPFYVELGARIRIAREFAGWSQLELGEVVNMKRASVSNIENGLQRVMTHDLATIAVCLNVPIERLIPHDCRTAAAMKRRAKR